MQLVHASSTIFRGPWDERLIAGVCDPPPEFQPMKLRPDLFLRSRDATRPGEPWAMVARLVDRLRSAREADFQSFALLLAVPLVCAVAVRPLGLRLVSDLCDVAFLLSLAGYGAIAWQRRQAMARARRRPTRPL
jgi:hypothetical protein